MSGEENYFVYSLFHFPRPGDDIRAVIDTAGDAMLVIIQSFFTYKHLAFSSKHHCACVYSLAEPSAWLKIQ